MPKDCWKICSFCPAGGAGNHNAGKLDHKSEGAEIASRCRAVTKEIAVFTTRPDTLFGVTYMVLAAEHPLVEELTAGTEQEAAVRAFVEKRS